MSRLRRALLGLVVPAVAIAQPASRPPADRAGTDGIEIWAGYSSRSPSLGWLGHIRGMSLALAGARFTHRVAVRPRLAIDYTFDVIPMAMVSPAYVFDPDVGESLQVTRAARCRPTTGCRFPFDSPRGAGVSPLGFTAVFRREHALQFRLGGTGGMLLFDRRVPTEYSTQFNFTASAEVGTQLLDRHGRGVLLVYRFHHISNAGTGFDNSALASHVLSVGGRWRGAGQ